jgi:hypothetical protein
MRPSDSPAASARLRSALGCALPVGQALVLCAVTVSPRGRPPDRLLPTARRRGSPVLRRPDLPTGRSGVSQVTGPSSSAVPRSTTPPVPLRLALSPPGVLPSGVPTPWALEHARFRGCLFRGPPVRLTTLQPPPYRDGSKPGYQPAGYALAGWASHPRDDSSEFQSTSSTSSPTGIAWSLREPLAPLGPAHKWAAHRGRMVESSNRLYRATRAGPLTPTTLVGPPTPPGPVQAAHRQAGSDDNRLTSVAEIRSPCNSASAIMGI